MAEDLPTTITEAAGQAATVRVGTVTAISPLAISLNGTALNMDAVGVIGGGFVLGAPVVLLGQSVQGGSSSGTTWCALGTPVPAGASDWTSYPVVWTSTSGVPSLGTGGRLTGRYTNLHVNTYALEVELLWGPATAALGRWFFSLPFPASAASSAAATGAAYILDTGTANRAAICNITTDGLNVFVTATPNGDVGAGVPQVWAPGDQLRLSLIFEKR